MSRAKPHPKLKRGVFLRPEVTPDGKHVLAAYDRRGVEIGRWAAEPEKIRAIRQLMISLLSLSDPDLRLV